VERKEVGGEWVEGGRREREEWVERGEVGGE
jgi:hypothetical protein